MLVTKWFRITWLGITVTLTIILTRRWRKAGIGSGRGLAFAFTAPPLPEASALISSITQVFFRSSVPPLPATSAVIIVIFISWPFMAPFSSMPGVLGAPVHGSWPPANPAANLMLHAGLCSSSVVPLMAQLCFEGKEPCLEGAGVVVTAVFRMAILGIIRSVWLINRVSLWRFPPIPNWWSRLPFGPGTTRLFDIWVLCLG